MHPIYKKKKLLLGSDTHFEIRDDGTIWCTHGNWTGTPTYNADGSVDVDIGFKVAHYDTHEFYEEEYTHEKIKYSIDFDDDIPF